MRRFGGKEYWQSMRKVDKQSRSEKNADFKSEEYKNYELQTWTDDKLNKPFLCVYKGLSGKAISYYWYRTLEQRQNAVEGFKDMADSQEKYKVEKKEALKNLVNVAKVGDILDSSWGYDQTNIDFYEVVGVTAKSVKIEEIGQTLVEQTGYDSETVVPNRNSRSGKIMMKRIKSYNKNEYYVSIASYAIASKWDGSPCHQSHGH